MVTLDVCKLARAPGPFVLSSVMTSFHYNVNRAPVNRCAVNLVSPWLDAQDLSRLVQKSVAEADWEQMGPMGLPFPRSERNATFLGILAYSYALGIYPTRDIIQTLVKDKGGHALALMGLNAPSLRRFRRAFRRLLAQCLAAVLEALTQKRDCWASSPMTRETFAAEAERRIGIAIDWDSDPLDSYPA